MRRLGPQVASRTWAFRHQGHGGQSATKSCSSNGAGGRQTHALHGLPRERQNVISSCVQWEGHGAWSGPTDGQFLLEAPHEGGACQRHAVGGCLFESGCSPDLANCTRQELLGNVSASEARQMLQESRFSDVQKQS